MTVPLSCVKINFFKADWASCSSAVNVETTVDDGLLLGVCDEVSPFFAPQEASEAVAINKDAKIKLFFLIF